MKLYTYFRSSAAFRVRIGLNLKRVAYDAAPLHLTRDGGEHLRDAYRAANPQGLVPALEDGGAVIGQSLAILEYLDERHPEPPFLPRTPLERAQVRSMALAIACDIHPLNNLRVLNYLKGEFGRDEEAVKKWYRHWIAEGFRGLEALVRRSSIDGKHCFGDSITLADICLVPQMYNARRFNCDLSAFPSLVKVDEHLSAQPAFASARPEAQPDAQ
jgi:maleylacetoacetate isomerase